MAWSGGYAIDRTRVWVGYYVGHFWASVNPPLLVVMGGLAYALATVPQIVELYVVELTRDASEPSTIPFGAAAAALFSLTIYGASRILPDLFLFGGLRDRPPRWAEDTREIVSVVLALAPWIGMGLGLGAAQEIVETRLAAFPETTTPSALFESRAETGYWTLAACAFGVVIAIFGWRTFRLPGRPPYWRSSWFRIAHGVFGWAGAIALGAALLVAVFIAVEPALGIGQTVLGAVLNDAADPSRAPPRFLVWAAHEIGAFAVIYLALMTVFVLGLALFIILPGLFAPEIATVVVTLVAAVALFGAGATPASDPSAPAPVASTHGAAGATLESVFRRWVAERPEAFHAAPAVDAAPDDAAPADVAPADTGPADTGPADVAPAARKPPVYVIAASGGGAYAAAHAAHVLGALQDRNPAFAGHVFAISAVSGGAVGAALFNAVAAGLAETSGDPAAFGDGPRAQLLRALVLGPHLAPLVAEAPGTALTRFLGRADDEADRAAALRHSYVSQVEALDLDGAARRFQHTLAAQYLNADYHRGWETAAPLPALVLNATNVDTGAPVAFAPFTLSALGEDELYSYQEWFQGAAPDVSTLEAAIVSARFPGILPAFTPQGAGKTTNFVDGGYADASGAEAALAIYREIATLVAADARLNALVEPRLLILAGRYVASGGLESSGTRLVDTLAPVKTVLNVRSQQAQRAVARAQDAFAREPGWRDRLRVITLDTEALKLPLAWRLSASSYDAIAASIGDPEACPAEPTAERARLEVLKIRDENACALKWTLDPLEP